MTEQIQPILDNILATDGINGAMVFDADGDLLGTSMPAVYTDDMLHDVADQIVSTLLTLKEMKMTAEDLTYTYEEYRIVVRALQRYGYLFILSVPNLSTSLLNITTNVSQKKLQRVLSGKAAGSRTPAKPPRKAPEPAPPPVASTPRSVTSSNTATSTGASLPYGMSAFMEETDMAPEVAVFNVILGELMIATQAVAPPSKVPFLEEILAALGTLKVNGAIAEDIRSWCRSNGEARMTHAPGKSDISRILHALYIFMVDYHGPVITDRLVKQAIRNTEKLPAARDFSVKSLF